MLIERGVGVAVRVCARYWQQNVSLRLGQGASEMREACRGTKADRAAMSKPMTHRKGGGGQHAKNDNTRYVSSRHSMLAGYTYSRMRVCQ